MLYATKGQIIAIIAKDYQHSKIITRVYDCSQAKPRLRLQTERKSITKAKDYLHHKFHLEEFNCLAPTTFLIKGVKKRSLNKVKKTCEDLLN